LVNQTASPTSEFTAFAKPKGNMSYVCIAPVFTYQLHINLQMAYFMPKKIYTIRLFKIVLEEK